LDAGQYLLLVVDGKGLVHTESVEVPRSSRLNVDLATAFKDHYGKVQARNLDLAHDVAAVHGWRGSRHRTIARRCPAIFHSSAITGCARKEVSAKKPPRHNAFNLIFIVFLLHLSIRVPDSSSRYPLLPFNRDKGRWISES
jgi:hypothetical protein